MLRVLVTNDDGVRSVGLHALAAAAVGLGLDVVVAAPAEDMSGSGAAIGRFGPGEDLEVQRVEIPGCDGVPAYSVPGPPGLAVLAARLGAFGAPPQLVASGVNPGGNTGRAILHSGTVGAALTAANFGASAVAVSIAASGAPSHWGTAAELAAGVLGWLAGAPERTVVNLNVPDRDMGSLRGVRSAALAPFGTVRASVVEPAGDQGGRVQMELRETGEELPADCDTALVLSGFATLTLLAGIRPATLDPGPLLEALRAAGGGWR